MEELARITKYNYDGLTFILGHDNFDEIFPTELLDHIKVMMDGMLKNQRLVMDAVQTLLMKIE